MDTELEYIKELKKRNIFIANFEDLGKGTLLADVVINALYDEKYKLTNHYWGEKYYCLKDEFHITKPVDISEKVNNILLTFGGTDPNNYTLKVLEVLSKMKLKSKIEVILGLGYKQFAELEKQIKKLNLEITLHRNVSNMSRHMQSADLIFTSAGRTIYEIASLGVPNIVLAQNQRELHHTFASADNGIVNLKLGFEVTEDELISTIQEVISNVSIRKKNHEIMLNANLRDGITTVINTIFTTYEEWERNNA